MSHDSDAKLLVGQRIILPTEAKKLVTIPKWKPFPLQALPEPVRSFVSEGATAIGCDPAMIALPALAVCAAAIGATRALLLKRSWLVPCVLWCLVVARSGKLKSPAHNYAVTLLRGLDGARLRAHDAALKQYERDKARYKAELAAWREQKKNKKGGQIGERPVEPCEPRCVQYVVKDATVEAIAPILQDNPRGLLSEREEASGWFKGFNQYKGGKGSDVANWLEMYDAGALKVNRKGAPIIYVPRAAVSVCGTIQPTTLQENLTREFFECGLAARLLLAAPPPIVKQWTEADVRDSTRDAFAGIIGALLSLDHDIRNGELVAKVVTLAPEARQLWIEWYNEFAGVQDDASDDDLGAALAKIEGVAARLALVIHYVRWAASHERLEGPLDAESMAAGIQLARWFASEAERVYGLWSEDADQRQLRELVEQIHKKGKDGKISVRDWQWKRSHRNSAEARAELDRLVAAGRGRWLTPVQSGAGRPTELFQLIDGSDTDKTACHAPENGGSVGVGIVGDPVVVEESPRAETPADDSDRRHSEAMQHVEGQEELGLPIEPDPEANQRWAKEA